MFKTIAPLQQVLDQLVEEQRLSPDAPDNIAQTVAQWLTARKTPWYIRGLVGIGGWFAAMFFIGFLAVAEIVTDETGAIIVGAFFCILAVGIKYVNARSIFVGQLTLAFSLAGQILFIGGLGSELNNLPLTILITIILEGLLIVFYPDKLHRFLSTLVICGALFYLFVDEEVEVLSHLLVLLLATGTVLLWQNEAYLTTTRLFKLYRPLGYALPIALVCFLFLSFVDDMNIEWWWLSAGGLLLVLLYLEVLILNQLKVDIQTQRGWGVLAGTAILIIPASQTPGILAALIVLLLGYQRDNRLLLGLATAFLTVFVIGYYYNLELTLLTKSFVLMGTGLIFLGIRYLLSLRGER